LSNEQDVKPKVPHLVIGTFERLLAFFLVWLVPAERAGIILLAWMTAKLAANWQRREDADQEIRARTLIALITGTLSLSFGVVGGAIAKHGPNILQRLL
jgi:hypothetical protein